MTEHQRAVLFNQAQLPPAAWRVFLYQSPFTGVSVVDMKLNEVIILRDESLL